MNAFLGLAVVSAVIAGRPAGVRMPPLSLLLLGFVAAAAVSAVTGINPWCGLDGPFAFVRAKLGGEEDALWCGIAGVLDLGRAAAVFILGVALLTTPGARRLWLALLAVVAGIIAAAGLVEYVVGHRTVGVLLRDPAVGHPNQTAAFLVVAMPVAAMVGALRDVGKPSRWGARAALAVGMAALVFTQSLTGWVAAAAVGVVLVRRFRAHLALIVPAAVVLAAAAAVVVLTVPAWDKLNLAWVKMSLGVRLQWWQGTLAVVADHPLLGVGPRSLRHIDANRFGFEPAFHAHNLYLNIAAEQGLVGLAAFLAILGAIAWHLKRTHGLVTDGLDTACWYSAAGALVALVILGLATTPHHSRTAIMFWAIIAVYYAQFAGRQRPPSRPDLAHPFPSR
jgi:putative inorganic carbon (HCO3(-)) transporter